MEQLTNPTQTTTTVDVDLILGRVTNDLTETRGTRTFSIASARPAVVRYNPRSLFDPRDTATVTITADLGGELDASIEIPAAALLAVLTDDSARDH